MIKRYYILLLLIPFIIGAQNNNLKDYDSIREAIIQSGRQAYFKKKLAELKKITKQVYSIYSKNNDSILLAKYYHFKALQNKLTYKNDSTFYYYHESKNISKLTRDSIQTGRRLLSIAVLQRNVKDYLGSEISSIEALHYLEPVKSYRFIEIVYNNLGIVAEKLGKIEEASIYYNKALKINKENKNDREYLFTINNLGFLYQTQSKHKIAIDYFLKGLSFDSIKEKYTLQYALLLENLTY